MDVFVQMVRNALCCVKDLTLFPGTVIHDPSITAKFYNFPEPLNHTTPLELLIALTQLYACVSTSLSGYRLITGSGLGKLRKITRLMEMKPDTRRTEVVGQVINESLAKEGSSALRSIWVGTNVLGIGISFFWLFANSLHITETDWIGGLPGLIHALTVMEIALIPLLYYMIKDGTLKMKKAAKMRYFSTKVASCEGKLGTLKGGKEIINAETFGWVQNGGWCPFWTECSSLSVDITEGKMLAKEVEKVQNIIHALLTDEKKSENKNIKIVQQAAKAATEKLEAEAERQEWEGYLEYAFFVLNFIAFYGYLLGVVCYYYQEHELHGSYTGMLKFGFSNNDADWHGNFAGDLMWTFEPILIFANPVLMNLIKSPKTKVKTD